MLTLLLIMFTFSFYTSQSVRAADTINLTVNTNKGIYYLREMVKIYGTLESDGTPVSDAMLAIEVDTPLASPLVFRTITMGTPPTSGVNINSVGIVDEYGNPKDTFYIPIPAPAPNFLKMWVNVTVESSTTFEEVAVVFTVYDNSSIYIGSSIFGVAPLIESITCYQMYVFVGAWATTGTATIYASIYTKRPLQGGYPLCPEKVATFTIARGSGGPGGGSLGGGSGGTGTCGTYECEFRLSPEPEIGIHTVYCNAKVGQELKQEFKTFQVKSASYPPQASFTYKPSEPLLSGTVTFDASASTPEGGEIASYKWNFGDGTSPSTVYVRYTTHVFPTNNTFTVTLNVTDSEGLWCTTSKPVKVSPVGPTAVFTYFPSDPFVDETTTFNASSSTPGWNGTANPPIVSYEWNFGDGTSPVIESDPITTHIFRANDTFHYLQTSHGLHGFWPNRQFHLFSFRTSCECNNDL